jgi:hypothetical protein
VGARAHPASTQPDGVRTIGDNEHRHPSTAARQPSAAPAPEALLAKHRRGPTADIAHRHKALDGGITDALSIGIAEERDRARDGHAE